MTPWLRYPLLVIGLPLFAAMATLVLVLLVIFSLVEVIVSAAENRRPQLPPASHPDGTPLSWREFIRGTDAAK